MRHLALIALLAAGALSAQDCSIPFTEPLFEVQVESGVWYGNATRYNGGTDSLRLNLYKPVGDGQTERPLVVLIHGGGFYEGNRNDFNAMAQGLAANGWAAATISYRLGFYGSWLFGPPYPHDPYEVRRAIYRAMQDAKGAIRFLKGRHEQDSTSTSAVFVLGGSAGAITALHAAYLDRPEEKPNNCGAIGDVQHIFNFYPRPDLGPVDGELNQNGHDASVLGVINLYGALMDTSYVESAGDPALFSYHQTGDPVVGCGVQQPYWGIGLGIPDNNPWLYGSCAIDARMQHLGFTPQRYRFHLHQGNEHAVHDQTGVMADAVLWMRQLICDITTGTAPDGNIAPARLAPNPAQAATTLALPGTSPATYTLLDLQGRTVGHGSITGGQAVINLGHLRPGTYLVRTGDGGVLPLVKE
ncbi:MAG TPA: carboxylesterase family protein [Flavobacteriales bacterium]|nr:carboxylesterase family protein [Flavobacteriales bacterium]